MMKTVEEKLINSRTFITNVHQLANSYYISDAEAQSLLLDEILQHRLGSYNDQEIIQSLADNSSVFNWKITFAAKDVGKKISQQRRRESETVDMLKLGINDSFVINLSNVANSKGSDTARVIQLLPKLLRKKSTRDFISLTLLYGEIETRERLGITEKQFKKKIENIEAFCKRHRQRFVNLVINKEDEKFLSTAKRLSELIGFIENENYSDDLMQSIINKHKSFLNDILGAYADYPVNPKQLLKNYASQPNKEKYKLINCIYENEYYVRRRLKREATQMRTATL